MKKLNAWSAAVMVAIVPIQLSPAAASPIGTAPALGGERSIMVHYGGRLFGIPVVRAKISASFDGESYAARAEFRTSGLAAFFKQITVVASAKGNIVAGELSTWEYWHKELDGRKNRELFMNYGPTDIKVRVIPPLHSMGDPPASTAQRLEAMDPVSALLSLAISGSPQSQIQQCAGRVKVFDGKQRYDLRLQSKGLQKVHTRAYKGLALRCEVWYVPVAGFNADDLQDGGYDKPITMWLAHELQAGMHLPVRFEAKLDFGTAVIEAIGIDISVKDKPG